MRSGKVVIFDIYDTLLKIETDENGIKAYEFISNWLTYQGVHISPENLLALYRQTTKELISLNKEQYPDIDIGDVFARITKRDDLREELALLFRMLTTKSLDILPYTKTVLDGLNKKVRLAIASNSQHLFTMPELTRFGIAGYFRYILFSSDIKACKPNPKIFLKALDGLKVKPHNAIYVGDDLFNDVWGAKKAGMKTVWLNHGRQQIIPQGIEAPVPDMEVKTDNCANLAGILLSMI